MSGNKTLAEMIAETPTASEFNKQNSARGKGIRFMRPYNDLAIPNGHSEVYAVFGDDCCKPRNEVVRFLCERANKISDNAYPTPSFDGEANITHPDYSDVDLDALKIAALQQGYKDGSAPLVKDHINALEDLDNPALVTQARASAKEHDRLIASRQQEWAKTV